MVDLQDASHHGWRQGVVLPLNYLGLESEELTLSRPLNPEDRLIIITQDCDLVHYSLEEEPFFEVIVARAIGVDQQDANKRDGKNPRRLQFDLSSSAGVRVYEAWMAERRYLKRELLITGGALYESVGTETLQTFKKWLARRYTRAALPTVFNGRITTAQRKIVERLKSRGRAISAILLNISSFAELPPTETYSISVVLLIRPGDYEQKSVRDECVALLSFIRSALLECDGIDVEEVRLATEDDLTMSDTRRLLRWDYADYLSARSGHAPELPTG